MAYERGNFGVTMNRILPESAYMCRKKRYREGKFVSRQVIGGIPKSDSVNVVSGKLFR